LCVDFRNLNQVSLEGKYALPNKENLLQRVIGVGILSMLVGFSGYNHFLVKEEDPLETTFTTAWGTYKYLRMSFDLLNVA
jgi:hypothetical protein